MNTAKRRTSRAVPAWRLLAQGMFAVAGLAWTLQAAALTNIGPGAFSGGATKINFEDLPGDNSDIPAGYASSSGIASFQGATESEVYTDYGSTLATNATTAGLGNVGATWGCNGTCGTGFTLNAPRVRVGAFLSSNVDITVQVSAFRGGLLLGSQTPSFAADQIGFVGFEDPAGIDRIVIGDNTLCAGCIHQLDNIMFENALGASGPTAVPTLSQWGAIVLSGLVALGTVLALRRRRQ